MLKTARLSFLSIAIILIVAMALTFLYLLERQEIYSNLKDTNLKLVQQDADYFDKLSKHWESTLKDLSRHNNFKLYVNALAKQRTVKVYRQQLQNVFNKMTADQHSHIRLIRFIDAKGNEKLISRNAKTVWEVTNLSNQRFFQRAITTRVGEVAKAEFDVLEDSAFIQLSTAIVADNTRLGVLSISIDVKSLLSRYDYLLSVNVTDSVALLNRQGKVLYHTQSEYFNRSEMEKAFPIITQNSTSSPIMEYQKNIWSFVRNKPFDFYVLFVSKGDRITGYLNSQYKKIGIIFGVSSLMLVFIVFTSTRKIQRQQGKTESKKIVTKQRSHNFASISGEMRRPINTLLGSLVTLSETDLDKKQREYARTANHSAKFLLELVNEFQDYSKISQGIFKLHEIDFDLRFTVHDVAELMSAQAYKKGLEVSCLVSSDVPKRVRGDATRLRQVLINLLSYAILKTDNGEVSLCISTEDYAQSSKMIVIDISDTGNLVDQETITQLISMFTDIDLDDEENYTSEGLGLALSKQLVSLMSGELAMRENNLGGNTFQIRLPLPVVSVVEKAEKPERKAKDKLGGKRILIVGEIENNRNALSQAFAHWGMSGATMEEFDRVVNVLRDAIISNNPFDVCLIDVSLSSSSEKAFDLVRQIRQEYQADVLSLVTLTAQGVPGDASRAKKLGAQAYLTKPVSRESMLETMLRIFSGELHEKPEFVTKHSLKEGDRQSTHRLLLAEPDSMFNKQLVRFFKQAGILVDLADTGPKTEMAIKSNVYDIVLISATLSGLNVYQYIQNFRKDEAALNDSLNAHSKTRIHMPFIGILDNWDPKIAEKCKSSGMDDVIKKPFDAAKLDELVAHYLSSND